MKTMTISESNLSAINTASQLLTSNSSQNQSMNSAEQAMSGLTNLGGSFSSIFAGAQQIGENMNSQTQPNNSSEANSIDAMQQSLFSSLGFGNLSGETGLGALEQLAGQSLIETMQSSLLSALQTRVFSAQPEVNSALNDSNAETVDDSVMNSLSQFSFGENGLDLKDGFDTFNILQHIPVVSAIYQDVSGQDISAISKLSGGYFYGGPIGLAFSALGIAIESYSGSSVSETLVNFDYNSLFSGENVESEAVETSQTKTEYFPLAGQMAASSRTQR